MKTVFCARKMLTLTVSYVNDEPRGFLASAGEAGECPAGTSLAAAFHPPPVRFSCRRVQCWALYIYPQQRRFSSDQPPRFQKGVSPKKLLGNKVTKLGPSEPLFVLRPPTPKTRAAAVKLRWLKQSHYRTNVFLSVRKCQNWCKIHHPN